MEVSPDTVFSRLLGQTKPGLFFLLFFALLDFFFVRVIFAALKEEGGEGVVKRESASFLVFIC